MKNNPVFSGKNWLVYKWLIPLKISLKIFGQFKTLSYLCSLQKTSNYATTQSLISRQ